MAKQTEMGNNYVKKSTLMLACLVAVVVGFLGGIVYSAFKAPSAVSMPGPVPGQQPAADGKLAAERAGVIAELEKETAQNPGNVKAWIELGNHYFDTDQFEKSIQAYEKALALKPDNADVLTDMGVMYRRAGQPQEALAAFDKAIAVDPRHEISRFNKGIVLMHDLNDQKGAVEAWSGLVRINPQAKSPGGILIEDMVEKMQKGGS